MSGLDHNRGNGNLRIPRVIHRIWLGDDPMPADCRRCGESWRAHHPGWRLETWTDERIAQVVDLHHLARARNASEASDIVRYHLLARYGGVYVDTDVECLRSVEPLIEGLRAFAAWERENRVGSAVIGAVPGHPAMVHAANAVVESAGVGDQIDAAGPRFITRVLRDFPDVAIFSEKTFYPYRWYEPRLAPELLADSYAIHHSKASWVPHEERLEALVELLARTRQQRVDAEAKLQRSRDRVKALKARLRKSKERKARRRVARGAPGGERLLRAYRTRLGRWPGQSGVGRGVDQPAPDSESSSGG